MRTFFTIWFGQLVSLLGSQLTGFALGVWVYEQTHSVSMLALVQVAMQVPYVLLSPLAGVFADRWNRRTAMIVSDFGAGLSVLAVAALHDPPPAGLDGDPDQPVDGDLPNPDVAVLFRRHHAAGAQAALRARQRFHATGRGPAGHRRSGHRGCAVCHHPDGQHGAA